MSPPSSNEPVAWQVLGRRHQLWGWRMLLVFLTLGLALETMHGLKLGFYLDPPNGLRRELWRLAHAHGTLVGILHLLFSAAISGGWWRSWPRMKLCSNLLIGAAIFLPAGFFLGGIAPSEGDPWIGILWVPLGGLFLFGAVLLAATEVGRFQKKEEDPHTGVHS